METRIKIADTIININVLSTVLFLSDYNLFLAAIISTYISCFFLHWCQAKMFIYHCVCKISGK